MEFPVLKNTQNETVANTEFSKPETNDIATSDMITKIDIACNNEDVEFILEVLKSEDMLYVSRAIKRCTWLITDPQYAHIINPEYLHSQLFPHMKSKASKKLEQNIKLYLKDMKRVEAFYNYYYCEEKNPQAAFQWLPNCSGTFIDTEVQKNADKINRPLMERLMDTLEQKHKRKVSTIEQCEELKQNWNSTESPNIKIALFQKAYNLLIKEESPATIEEIWQLLSMFFDNLPHDESKQLLSTLNNSVLCDSKNNISKVPLTVRASFFTKCFNHLKSISASESILKSLVDHSNRLMEFLDEEFASEIVEYVANNLESADCDYNKIISSFLLCVKDEKTQIQRYQRILVPLLERSFAKWQTKGSYKMMRTINDLLRQLNDHIKIYVLMNDMIYPIKMFTAIQKLMEERLSSEQEQHYSILTYWKLIVSHLKILEEHKALVTTTRQKTVQPADAFYDPRCDETWNEVYNTVSADFAKICVQYLKEDVEKYGSSVYLLFADTLFGFNCDDFFKHILLEDKEFIESYLLVMEICPWIDGENCELLRMHPSARVKLHYTQSLVRKLI